MNLPGYSVVVNAHPAVIDIMKGDEREAVQEAERLFMRRIELVPRKEYHLEQFDLAGEVEPWPTTNARERSQEGRRRREDARHDQQRVRVVRRVHQEYVTNISRTGVFIRSKTPLADGHQGEPALHRDHG